jgi:peptidylprolyl isomerase
MTDHDTQQDQQNAEPKVAHEGDTVHLHYTGRLDDGSTFDSSEGREPLSFTIGDGKVIPGFDRGVRGMTEGEQKTIHIDAKHAYGPHDPERVMAVQRSQFPDDLQPEIGLQVHLGIPGGGQLPATITSMDISTVTLDANHALAGKDLTFDLHVVQIEKGDDDKQDQQL